jgi:tetratricopeptide (TPR) repeat protein
MKALSGELSNARPFPGLRPFGYLDHYFFFGREEQIYSLYRLIDATRFVAVVGSSGSGKSSLVRAGLLPLLDLETRNPGGRTWQSCEMRPGDAPLQRLVDVIAKLAKDDDPIIASARRERIALHLRRSSFGISDALDEIGGLSGHTLLLVVDQFEELFRFASETAGPRSNPIAEARARDQASQFVQLLMEASRARAHPVHIVLTMRSDFIGECARFHDLPEVVSANQFLVPALTRDQLEEVIRQPIKKAGATIQPELVERLLNDCGSDLDQLPVLQHCLLRLWDKAGAAASSTPANLGGEQSHPNGNSESPRSRALLLEHYREVDGFAGALSQHADEILRILRAEKLETAVEQTFRALSELDKEGRAVRRALQYSQLCAETGVGKEDLRKVLDRFRAQDCSFLVPSVSETPILQDETRIDVGHEALLRRWERVSGRGTEIGWLRKEQQDGERYRGLLSMADDEGATLPSHLTDERWEWWNSRPRSSAWANRYGGGFELVSRLLQRSRVRRQVRRVAAAASFLAIAGTAAVLAFLWGEATTQSKRAQHNYEVALKATQDSVGKLSGYLDSGDISIKGAEAMLKLATETVENLKVMAPGQPPELGATGTWLLLTISDANVALAKYDEAFALSKTSHEFSKKLSAQYPNNVGYQKLHYASTFRFADALSRKGSDHLDTVLQEYKNALTIAQQLIKRPDDAEGRLRVAFIVTKIGDVAQAKRQYPEALVHYNEALRIREAEAKKNPAKLDYRRDVAAAHSRIGQALQAKGDYDGALVAYKEGYAIQAELVKEAPDDSTYWSNLATSHRRIGGALNQKKNHDESLKSYEAATAIRRNLVRKDRGNALWRSGLATDLVNAGDVYMSKGDAISALQRYQQSLRQREELAFKDPGRTDWKRNLADSHRKVAEAAAAQHKLDPAIEHFRKVVSIHKDLTSEKTPGSGPWQVLYDSQLKLGDYLIQRGDHGAALQEYEAAQKIVRAALDNDADSTLWKGRFTSVSDKVAAVSVPSLNSDPKSGAEPKSEYHLADERAQMSDED